MKHIQPTIVFIANGKYTNNTHVWSHLNYLHFTQRNSLLTSTTQSTEGVTLQIDYQD